MAVPPDLNSPEQQAAYRAEQDRLAQERAAAAATPSAGEQWDKANPTAATLANAPGAIMGAVGDMFSAETVSGPKTGQWGQAGTQAAAQNASNVATGQAIAAGTNQTAGSLLGQASGAGQRQAPTTNYAGADRYASMADSSRNTANQYLNQAGSSAQQDQQLAALNNFANQGPGPSAAEAQLQAGSDAAQRGALSMARSGRGAGDSASSLRDAMFSNASTQAQTNQAAAGVRAQETADFQNRKLSALNAAMGGAGAIRSADAQATQLAQGTRGQDQASQQQAASQSQFNTTTAQNQTQINDAAKQGLINSAQGFQGMGIDAGLGYAQLGQGALDSQAQYELEQQQMRLDASKANQSADLEKDSGITGMATSALGAMAMFSDERAKELEQRESSLAKALETVGNAPGYSYRYKDPSQPGAKEGRMVGPMAQDIERGPLGDSIVMDTPQGKMLDKGRLEAVNTSAITELNHRLNSLERSLGGGRKAA